jgi:hypothetical protein
MGTKRGLSAKGARWGGGKEGKRQAKRLMRLGSLPPPQPGAVASEEGRAAVEVPPVPPLEASTERGGGGRILPFKHKREAS